MDVLQHALAWINQYGDPSAPCENVLDLCDGVAFARVLAALAPDWFTLDGVRTDASANWVLAQNNLRTVLRNMEDYYRTVLHADMDFGAVDANAIARKDGDVVDQLLQVTELLVGLAVQCENKAQHVGVIMGLPVESQTSLQYLIQQALSKARPYSAALDGAAEADAPPPAAAAAGSGGDHALSAAADAAAAVAALQQQLAAAEAAAADLREQLLAESRACEELQDENRALREVTAAAARSGGSGGAHAEGGEGAAAAVAAAALAGARAQVAELQAALEEREREAADARDAARRAAALRDRDAALRATLEADARRMADELDLAQGAAARLRAAEASLERYRARLEELAPLREHVRELEQQSAQYLEQILTLEGEVKAMDTLRRKVEQYKDEKIEMERTSFQAASALTLKQDEVTRLKASLQEALDAKRYFENELIGARDAARAQGVARGESGDGGSGSTADAGGGGGGGGLGLFESAATLSEKVQRLQRENAALRAQLGGGGSGGSGGGGGDAAAAAELRGELEDALRAKRERGDEALAAKRQAAELEAQVHQLQERLASAEGRESAAQGAHSTAQLREMAQTVALLEAEADKARGLEMTLKYLEEQLKQKETELNTQQSDKAKLEQYMKRMFAKFKQDKAQAMRDVAERDAHIAALAEKGRADQAAFKREQQLMMSAVYEMGADISARHLRASMAPASAPPRPHGSGAGAGGSGSGTWMQQQRDMMQHRRDLG